MWISSLQEESGIITPLLKVRHAGAQYILITVSEQMCQRESSEHLLVIFVLTALLSALLLLLEKECKPQGETDRWPNSKL